jgi:hypothetical protein
LPCPRGSPSRGRGICGSLLARHPEPIPPPANGGDGPASVRLRRGRACPARASCLMDASRALTLVPRPDFAAALLHCFCIVGRDFSRDKKRPVVPLPIRARFGRDVLVFHASLACPERRRRVTRRLSPPFTSMYSVHSLWIANRFRRGREVRCRAFPAPGVDKSSRAFSMRGWQK